MIPRPLTPPHLARPTDTTLTRRTWLRVSAASGAAAALVSPSAFAADPAETSGVVDIGSRRELFVDRLLIDRLQHASLKLHAPVSGGVAIRMDRPWEGPANFGAVVLRDGKRFLMYYRAMTLEKNDLSGAYCVATSDDGATWTKPALGLVERAGRRDTNLIADEKGDARFSWSGMVWYDERPGVPADQRIKGFYSEPLSGEKHTAFTDPVGPKRLVMYASADGFAFRRLNPQPEIVSRWKNAFDGGNTMFWSEAERQYVLYYRWYDNDWGKGYRTVARTTSRDFLNWTAPVPMTYGDTPREQFYTNNTVPYFRAPHLYVALAARFMEGRRVVTDEQAQAIDLKRAQGHFYGNDCSDGVLLTSRAGSAQYDRTFMEALVRPGLGASNWVSRTNYPLTGIFPDGPNRMMFFVTRHYMQDSWHIERLLLRTDGFASINAPWSGGELVTKPLQFVGDQLEINFSTSAAGRVRVEIQDAAGQPLPGYAASECPEIIGDEIARLVRWKSGLDVSKLAGKAIRLRFELKDADLFSLRFTNGGK